MGYDLSSSENGTPTGWDINGRMNTPDKLEDAHKDSISRSHDRHIASSQKDLDKETKWLAENLSMC